jgi:hypothetical protein
VSTPTDGPGGQPDHPYGQPASPYGQPVSPYGAPPQPAGGGGYGASFPQGGPVEPESKGLAIAALVLSLIACGIPNLVSLVLAIVVLVKKKAGKGLAIAAIIIDVIVLVVVGLLVVGGVWLFGNVVTVDNAEVGQCVDTTVDGETVSMMKKDCSQEHDAVVQVVGQLSAEELRMYEANDMSFCDTRFAADGGDPESSDGDTWTLLTEEIPPGEGDDFVCLAENADGSKL